MWPGGVVVAAGHYSQQAISFSAGKSLSKEGCQERLSQVGPTSTDNEVERTENTNKNESAQTASEEAQEKASRNVSAMDVGGS